MAIKISNFVQRNHRNYLHVFNITAQLQKECNSRWRRKSFNVLNWSINKNKNKRNHDSFDIGSLDNEQGTNQLCTSSRNPQLRTQVTHTDFMFHIQSRIYRSVSDVISFFRTSPVLRKLSKLICKKYTLICRELIQISQMKKSLIFLRISPDSLKLEICL